MNNLIEKIINEAINGKSILNCRIGKLDPDKKDKEELDEIQLRDDAGEIEPEFWDKYPEDLEFIYRLGEYKVYYDYEEGWNFLFKNEEPLVGFIYEKTKEGYAQIQGIIVNDKYKGKGLGRVLYGLLIDKFGGIVSDDYQSNQAKKAWEKLMNQYKLFNYQTKKRLLTKEDFEEIYKPSQDIITILATK